MINMDTLHSSLKIKKKKRARKIVSEPRRPSTLIIEIDIQLEARKESPQKNDGMRKPDDELMMKGRGSRIN